MVMSIAPIIGSNEQEAANVRDVAAIPLTHGGVTFRSALEAAWACTLDHHGIVCQYEPWLLKLPSGVCYMPDFWLPGLSTFIEVKGPHMQRVEKAHELAEGADLGCVITVFGCRAVQ